MDTTTPSRVTNVLVVGMTANIGGIETLMRAIVHSCDPTVVHFDFLSNEPSIAYEDELTSLGCNSYHVTARRVSRSNFHRELRAFFEKHARDYDVIWENQNSAANIDYLVYAKRYGIPKRIIHCHNAQNGEGVLRGIMHTINRPTLASVATDFWTVSDESSEWFFGKNYKQLSGYRVFTNAIDVDTAAYDDDARKRCREELGVDEGTAILLNVGRLVPQKNQRVVLSCAAELMHRGIDAITLIAGEGPLRRELEAQAQELGISNRVRFLGMVGNVAELYSAADLFLFPSLFEGLSIALLEAQANGLPVVTSSAIVRSSIVNENVICVNVDDRSPVEWANATERALKIGRTAHSAVPGSEFDIKVQAETIQQLLIS